VWIDETPEKRAGKNHIAYGASNCKTKQVRLMRGHPPRDTYEAGMMGIS